MGSSKREWRRGALCAAIYLGMSVLIAQNAVAGNNDGSIVGHTQPGAQITVTSPDTGLTRSVTADSKGSYRFAFLPIGDYQLAAAQDGKALGETLNITVTLGNATTVNVGETASLAAI